MPISTNLHHKTQNTKTPINKKNSKKRLKSIPGAYGESGTDVFVYGVSEFRSRLVLFHGLNLLRQMWVRNVGEFPGLGDGVDGEREREVEELSHELGIGSEV